MAQSNYSIVSTSNFCNVARRANVTFPLLSLLNVCRGVVLVFAACRTPVSYVIPSVYKPLRELEEGPHTREGERERERKREGVGGYDFPFTNVFA